MKKKAFNAQPDQQHQQLGTRQATWRNRRYPHDNSGIRIQASQQLRTA